MTQTKLDLVPMADLVAEIARRSPVHIIGYLTQNNENPDQWNASYEGGEKALSLASQIYLSISSDIKKLKND